MNRLRLKLEPHEILPTMFVFGLFLGEAPIIVQILVAIIVVFSSKWILRNF